MSFPDILRGTSTFLENYWARSQVFRTGQFAMVMISGILQEKCPATASKLLTVATTISDMRTTLRVLDDIPALLHSINNLQSQKVQFTYKHVVIGTIVTPCEIT